MNDNTEQTITTTIDRGSEITDSPICVYPMHTLVPQPSKLTRRYGTVIQSKQNRLIRSSPRQYWDSATFELQKHSPHKQPKNPQGSINTAN